MTHKLFTQNPGDPGIGDYLMYEQQRRSVESNQPQPDGCVTVIAGACMAIGALAALIGGLCITFGIFPGYSQWLTFGGVVLSVLGMMGLDSAVSKE